MVSAPRVSICVPVYNGAPFLDACLSAIVAQTFADFEVLIVDDCSSDDSVAIARRWAIDDPRIKVHVNEVNRGLVGNWNRCIELSRGEWIKFLFQDDLMRPDCLAAMLEVGEASGGFVACSRDFLFEGSPDPVLEAFYLANKDEVDSIYGATRSLSPHAYCVAKLDHFNINVVGEPSVVLVRRRLFAEYGTFDPMLVQICDSEMWNRLGSNVGVEFIPRALVTFRVHAASTSEANRGRPFRGGILDGIIEAWKLCESPQFGRFRDSLRRAGRGNALRKQLDIKVHTAFYMLRDAEQRQPPDLQLRRELQTVLDQLGGFRQARQRHLWFRFKRLIGAAEAVP